MRILLILFLSISFWGCNAQETLTNELDGVEMTYKYSGGNAYNVKMENGNLSYRYLAGSKPEKWWGPFKYKAVKTNNGEFFLSWFEDGYGDIVTLLLNPANKTIVGSALIVKGEKKIFHFQHAKISEYKNN